MERLLHQEGRCSRATSQLYSEPRGVESSDRLLRLGGLGHNSESPWEGLLIHQQLALRAHRGKPSFHRGLCLERLESHHPPLGAGFDPLRRRQVKPAFKSPDKRELSSLFLYAAVAIPVFYLPALSLRAQISARQFGLAF